MYFLGGVAVGICAGILGAYFLSNSATQLSPLRQSQFTKEGYQFTDPLLGLNMPGNTTPKRYQSLRTSIESILKKARTSGDASVVSVFLKDENTSEDFAINPDEQYNPASLLKVPSMMAYYRLADADPAILKKELLYTGKEDLNVQENIRSPIQLTPAKYYTTEKLIEHMIKYSDNNAATLLVNYLNSSNNEDAFNRLFNELGIQSIDLTNDYITIRAYSLFFRVLYNATYLDRDMSEKALKLLSETDFTKGIEAGVPNNITVSQKFGEFSKKDTRGVLLERELHNCGIVYYPNHPYLLCVMTKGSDFTKLEAVIARISEEVFAFTERSSE